ncbi:MAG: FtsQ-type POTRA domain-containing protein [Pseudomonadota bacterium]
MPPVILEDLLALPVVGRARRFLQPAVRIGHRMRIWARSVRHPNALLASLVVLPTVVFGFSIGERTAEPRAAFGEGLTSMTVALGFGVEQITIEGLRDTRQGDVLDYLAVAPETPLLGFDLEAARERVLALPWVADASVRKVYPDAIFVDITEHEPFARMLVGGRIHLVTVDGQEITDEIAGVHQRLPLVVGEGAPRKTDHFFAALAERPHVLEDVVALELIGERRWTLHMSDRVQVHLPEAGVDRALSELESMMRQHAILDRAIASIDLRRPEQLVVRLTDEGLNALQGSVGEGGA